MRASTGYTEYHPRWLRRRISTYWWLERPSYLAFILRELSSVFVAWTVAFLLLLVHAVSQGDNAYRHFLSWSASPAVLLLNLTSLLFVVFHAATWFRLAPQAMVVHVRGRRLPGAWIAASNYLAWALATALVAWLLLGD
ncbi:MAG: fumarate reductase subunit C [Vicinamibacteria bacterium]